MDAVTQTHLQNLFSSDRALYDATGDADVRSAALSLIDAEADPKYRKKYATAWRGA